MYLVGLISHSFTLHFTLKKRKKKKRKIVITHVPIILNPQLHPSPYFYKSSASLITKQTTVAL